MKKRYWLLIAFLAAYYWYKQQEAPPQYVKVLGEPNHEQIEWVKKHYPDAIFDRWNPDFEGIAPGPNYIYFVKDTFGLSKLRKGVDMTIITSDSKLKFITF